jgi:hypothetical protein
MKLRIRLFALAVILALPAAAGAQDQTMTPEQEAAMKAWMEVATPGPSHKAMEAHVGVWDAVSYAYETGEKVEAGRGISTRTMILGGRFLQDHLEATMMGMPMEGWGLSGYNNLTGEVESTWIDNMGTAIYFSKGKVDADGKSIVQHMEFIDPMTRKPTRVKTVTRADGPDRSSFLWYTLEGDKETLTMEMVYTRRK